MWAERLGAERAAVTETGPFAAEQAGRLLRRLAYQAGRTAKSPRAGEVHDLRVAIRRFTQALIAFDSCFSTKAMKKARRRLRKVMGLAGEVRNCDIAMELVSKSKSPPTALISAFRKRRNELERALTRMLRRWSQRRSYSEWRAELESGSRGGASRDLIGLTARHTLAPMIRQFFGRGQRVLGSKAPAAKAHQLRITAKKLRYTLELFAPVYGAALDVWLERIKALQEVLGTISDCETVRAMIKGEGGDTRIESSLQRKVHRKIEEFRQLWANSFADGSIGNMIRQIGQEVPRKPAASSESNAPERVRAQAAHA